jgi:hypothetical protein
VEVSQGVSALPKYARCAATSFSAQLMSARDHVLYIVYCSAHHMAPRGRAHSHSARSLCLLCADYTAGDRTPADDLLLRNPACLTWKPLTRTDVAWCVRMVTFPCSPVVLILISVRACAVAGILRNF